jgi:hypothetical protein
MCSEWPSTDMMLLCVLPAESLRHPSLRGYLKVCKQRSIVNRNNPQTCCMHGCLLACMHAAGFAEPDVQGGCKQAANKHALLIIPGLTCLLSLLLQTI